jgi:hypothetical protein
VGVVTHAHSPTRSQLLATSPQGGGNDLSRSVEWFYSLNRFLTCNNDTAQKSALMLAEISARMERAAIVPQNKIVHATDMFIDKMCLLLIVGMPPRTGDGAGLRSVSGLLIILSHLWPVCACLAKLSHEAKLGQEDNS